MVSFAIILAEDDACGAAGFGAVMGSKKLKAIAVQGTKGPEPADPEKLKTLSTFLRKIKKKQPFQFPSPPQGAKLNKQICFGCNACCDRYSMELADGRRGKYMLGYSVIAPFGDYTEDPLSVFMEKKIG